MLFLSQILFCQKYRLIPGINYDEQNIWQKEGLYHPKIGETLLVLFQLTCTLDFSVQTSQTSQ